MMMTGPLSHTLCLPPLPSRARSLSLTHTLSLPPLSLPPLSLSLFLSLSLSLSLSPLSLDRLCCLSAFPDPGAARVHPDYLSSVEHVTWHNDTSLWVTAHNSPLDNIWYFAARMAPIYKARRLNATGALPFVLPSLTEKDILYMPNRQPLLSQQTQNWSRAFAEVVTGLDVPPFESATTPFGQTLDKSHVKCYKRAVLTGAIGYVVRSP